MPRADLVLPTRLAHSTLMGLPGYVLTAQDAVLTGNRKAATGKGAMRGGGRRRGATRGLMASMPRRLARLTGRPTSSGRR